MQHFNRLIHNAKATQPAADAVTAGNSVAAHALRQMVAIAARSTAPVLIISNDHPTKQAIAKSIHAASLYPDDPFVEVNCQQIAPDHFAIRWDGALFLDEITAVQLQSQLAMLDWINSDDGQYVRVIAGANTSLEKIRHDDQLIGPLLQAFSALVIPCPELSRRKADIPTILQRLWTEDESGIPPILERCAWTAIAQHGWSGDYSKLVEFAQLASIRFGGRTIKRDQTIELLCQE
jgi:DNA-binding NtrC family response regulator